MYSLGWYPAQKHSKTHKKRTSFKANKLPFSLEIFDKANDPGIAISWINNTLIINPILASEPSPQLISLVPKYTATSIIVWTAIL